jgi:hypothetical protein
VFRNQVFIFIFIFICSSRPCSHFVAVLLLLLDLNDAKVDTVLVSQVDVDLCTLIVF